MHTQYYFQLIKVKVFVINTEPSVDAGGIATTTIVAGVLFTITSVTNIS